MVRSRLASLALATGLLFLTGCCCCWNFPVWHRLRAWHPMHGCCSPESTSGVPIMDGPVVAPSDPVITAPPPVAPPPRVVPIPQAAPMPYTP